MSGARAYWHALVFSPGEESFPPAWWCACGRPDACTHTACSGSGHASGYAKVATSSPQPGRHKKDVLWARSQTRKRQHFAYRDVYSTNGTVIYHDDIGVTHWQAGTRYPYHMQAGTDRVWKCRGKKTLLENKRVRECGVALPAHTLRFSNVGMTAEPMQSGALPRAHLPKDHEVEPVRKSASECTIKTEAQRCQGTAGWQ